MKPKISDQQIDDYLMGKLSKDESKAFEIEVFGSPELLKEVQLREQMIGLIKNERETLIADYAQQKSPKQKSAIVESIRTLLLDWQKGWIYAGAAVAVLVVAIFITPRLLEQETEINLANFSESPRFESLMKSQIRSTGLTVSIVSPEIGQNFKTDVLFKWDIKKDHKNFSGPFDLKIMNHKESVIHSVEVTGGQYKSGKLAPGLYYWTIEEKGEMLYLGKFFVNKPSN